MDMEKWSGVVDWIHVCSECGPASKIRSSDGVFFGQSDDPSGYRKEGEWTCVEKMRGCRLLKNVIPPSKIF